MAVSSGTPTRLKWLQNQIPMAEDLLGRIDEGHALSASGSDDDLDRAKPEAYI